MTMKNEELIAAVLAKRCLWDQQNKYYHNRQIVDQNWIRVGEELNQDAICMKKKWKQLRDTFRTELKKDRSGDPGDEIYSQWPHFKSMMFLKDQIKCRNSLSILSEQFKSIDNIKKIDGEDTNNTIDMEIAEIPQNHETEEPYLKESDLSSFEQEIPTLKNPRKKLKRHHDDIGNEMIEIEKKKLMLMEQKSKNMMQSGDEDMAFFVSLLPHVRKMDPETKLLCRMEMQTSVLNHAYKNKSSSIQNVQSQKTCVSVPKPVPTKSVSTQFSGNDPKPK